MSSMSQKAVFCYIAPKVIDSRDEPPEHKPSRKRYSESAAIQKSCKPMSWDIYELQNKLAQSQKVIAIKQEVQEYNDSRIGGQSPLKIVINKVTRCKKQQPLQYTILKSRD